MRKITAFAILVVLFLSGCAKYELEDSEKGGKDSKKLVLKVSPFERGNFDVNPASRAIVDVSEVCTRLGFAVFDATGKKVLSINQDGKSSDFGSFAANLSEGEYDVVIVGHSTGGVATISSPDKITFKDNKVTDTFSYYERITISEDVSKEVTLKRSVAMFRLELVNKLPEDVKQLKFYYTGGSSTLNAMTNFGIVNSRQTELRDVPSATDDSGITVFEIYTLPHEKDDNLKIVITPLNAAGEPLTGEYSFEDVPVTQGMITTFTGKLFDGLSGGGDVSSSSFGTSVKADDSWTEQRFSF